jgi:hypothetical protein
MNHTTSSSTILDWRISSRCNHGECVQIGQGTGHIGVGDTKHPRDPKLMFTPGAWAAFTARVKRGE